ncbi:MAG TPA: aminotransferase class V-fold PLP-dependent enzyme [Gemmatimonadaceae bacterium]|jgi:selenocysteine lyase/cysteine desulfurase|nr:aminotransferase class V-fold PLP-dependent enzyme [Gemmatimonadaceae bacterium]
MTISPPTSLAAPQYDLDACRRRIPLLSTLIPMNNCSQAPQSHATRAAAERYLDGWNTVGMDWDAWMDEVRLAKTEFARLINASADDIAVFGSVSEATSAVASAMDFGGARRRVVVTEAEFPTVAHVWLAQAPRGATVTWAPVGSRGAAELASYAECIDETTSVVSACHGYYLNGALQDIRTIAGQAHAHGALLFVDAYQTIGTVPVDVRAWDVDFLAAGNLKFLMGVPGIAFLYVRPDVAARLQPMTTGWFGRANPFAFAARELDWAPAARRFDMGTPPVINAYIARAGMEMINQIGVPAIRAWLEVLGERLIGGAAERGLRVHGGTDMAHKTATTAIVVDDSHHVELAMRAAGVLPSARGPVVRLAPHFYNTIDDVDTALDVLSTVTTRT